MFTSFHSDPPTVSIKPIPPKEWIPLENVKMEGTINTEIDIVKANVFTNVRLGFQQVEPHITNDVEVMLVGGGPSLIKDIEKIRELREQGVKLICMNNAYQYCIDQGLSPSALVMVDARAFNSRFVTTVIPDCKYFIASQCNPEIFAKLPKEQTYIWHTGAEEVREILLENYERCYPVPGGSTVLLRAIPLFRMLGFKRFHIFGCDSCLEDGAHHAYSQPENDDQSVYVVKVGGKEFLCHAWMLAQAKEFIDLVQCMSDVIELEIYGGLLRQILQSGADRAALEEF